MISKDDAEIIAWILKVGDIQGHAFHGNQYSDGEGGGSAPVRQVDAGRFQVSSDRYGSTPDQTTDNAKPASADAEKPVPDNADKRVKTAPQDDSPKAISQWAKEIHFALKRGEQPIVKAKYFPALIAEMAKSGLRGNDVSKIRIDGTKLMGLNGKGIARKDMPQVDEKDRPRFIEDILKSDGVKADKVEIDPRTLQPIQKEINGDKCGGIMGAHKDGIPDSMRILITRDGFVLDGHHTWGASVGIAIAGGSKTIPAYRLDCDWKTAMKVALAWDKANGVKGQDINATLPKDKK
jgi:hypothetical protein